MPERVLAREFIGFAIEQGALRFGEFVLKSGRLSPYFFNSGAFDSGASLARLAGFYARAAEASSLEFDHLYGAAYKGIPLVAAVAVELHRGHGRDLPYSFNRKERKDHGEGGELVGAPLAGRVLIVDDVISAGTSIRESVAIIRAAEAVPAGALISLDRQERGSGPRSAVQEAAETLGVPVLAIATLDDLVEFLAGRPEAGADLERLRAYRRRYGVAAGR